MVLSLFKKKTTEKRDIKGVEYYQLRVKEVIRETDDTLRIVFDPSGHKIGYKPGQYLTLLFRLEGKEDRRSYSLCSSPYVEEDLAVAVKRVDQGKVSVYINEKIRAGDTIEVMEPKGNFIIDVDASAKRNVILFAGGSGITPLISIAKSILQMEPGSAVYLMYQNRNENSIVFKNELDALKEKYPQRFFIRHILSRPSTTWTGLQGRVSSEMVRELVNEIKLKNQLDSVFYLCGPAGMMETIHAELGRLNIPEKVIHRESFVASSDKTKILDDAPEAGIKKARVVTIILNGKKHLISVPPDGFILETALDADLNMPFSCQSGLCTACRGKLLSGKIYMNDPDGLSEQEINEGYVLSCVGQPLTDDVVIEIG